MKPNFTIALAFSLWTGLSAVSQAAIVLSDTFDSGTGGWYRAGTVGTLTNSAGQLSWTQGGDQNRQVIGRSFTPTTVGVGETLRLSFNYTQTGGSVAIFRVGLYNLENTIAADGWSSGDTNIGGSFAGFTNFVRDNDGTGNNARYETGTIDTTTTRGPLYMGTNIGTTDTTSYDINQDGSITYTVTYDITRNAGSVTTLLTMTSAGGTHYSISATTSATTALNINDFDMIGLRSGGGTMLIDNLVVELIPEPSAVLLSGIGATALLSRRRRKS